MLRKSTRTLTINILYSLSSSTCTSLQLECSLRHTLVSSLFSTGHHADAAGQLWFPRQRRRRVRVRDSSPKQGRLTDKILKEKIQYPNTPCMPLVLGGQCRHIWHTWSVWGTCSSKKNMSLLASQLMSCNVSHFPHTIWFTGVSSCTGRSAFL